MIAEWQELLSLSDVEYRKWLQTHHAELNISDLEAGKNYLETIDDWAVARRILKRLAQLAYALGLPLAIALFWRTRANELQYYQHFEQSIHASRLAAALYDKHGTQLDVAKARNAEVFCLRALERFSEAIELALWIRPHYEGGEFPLGEARLSHALAGVYAAIWNLNEALSEYKRAMELFRRLKLENDQAECLQNMGVLSHKLDRLEDAQGYYLQAYSFFEKHNRPTMQVRTLFNLAQNLLRLNRFDDALHHIECSRQFLADMPESADHAYADLFEAQVRQRLNQLHQAQGLLRQAILRFEQLGQRLESTQPRLALAHLISASSIPTRLYEALENLQIARSISEEFSLPLLTALLSLERAEVLFRLQRPLDARSDVESAIRNFTNAGLSLRNAQAEIMLADCCSSLEPEHAEALYRQNLTVTNNVTPSLTARCHHGLGRLASKRGDFDAAENHYKHAIQIYDTLRRSLRSHLHQAGLQEDAHSLSEELLQIISRQGGREKQVFSWVEHFKAVSLADLLVGQKPDTTIDEELRQLLVEREILAKQIDRRANAILSDNNTQLAASSQRGRALFVHDTHQEHQIGELRSQLQRLDEMVARQQHPTTDWRAGITIDIKEIHKLLDENTILISYFSIQDRLYALTVTQKPEDIQCHPLSVDMDDINKQWTMAKRYVMRPEGDPRRCRQYLGQLYRNLLEPFAARLNDKHRLIILPHRSLVQIPFAGLFDATNNLYVVQRWIIQLAPSATVLAHCQKLPKAMNASLFIGYPGEPGGPDFLNNVQSEVEGLAQSLPDCHLYYGEKATFENVMHNMPGSRIIHLAGHNYFDGSDPLASGMPLANGRWLRAADLYLRFGYLQGALVVLSGCDTSRGQTSGGDIVGLSSAYLYAGAHSVITSLWAVDDEATSTLMRLLYDNISKAQDAAMALATAQRDFINNERFTTPYLWSPFVLTGDSRVLIV